MTAEEAERERLREINAHVRSLRKRGKKDRLHAIQCLAWGGPVATPVLCSALGARDPDVRSAAAEALIGIGTSAVPPLCEVLKARNPEARAAAAAALGQIGDPRALEPLAAAFQGSFMGRSVKWQIVFGLVAGLFALLVALTAPRLVLDKHSSDGWLALALLGVLGGLVVYVDRTAASGRACKEIALALELIASAHPSRDLRGLLSDLHTVGADILHQDSATRSAAVRAARAIQHSTDLPIPSSPDAPDESVLPRPARAPSPDPASLPRVDVDTARVRRRHRT